MADSSIAARKIRKAIGIAWRVIFASEVIGPLDEV
jgi:hypothetical protein